jgi:RNA polymerase sigma factor (sigma-70 family)
MVNGRTRGAMRQVVRIFQDGTLAGLSDREVLGRFVDARDEAAFEALLARHGPMVWNVCRRILRHPDDADDAFQATFLALAFQASRLRIGDSLGPWLYRVASRVAARARADRRRRADRERSGVAIPEPEPERGEAAGLEEIGRAIHEELAGLPERLRAPMVLCYLEGMTHEQAARQLACPVGTVRSRLARARDRLRGRITRRGLVTTPAALDALLTSSGPASTVPPHLSISLVKVAATLAAGAAPSTGGCTIPARVAALLEGVLNVLRVKQFVGSMAALAAVGIVATVAALSVFPVSGQTKDAVDPRPIGPDGRRIGAHRGEETYVKTYYVGDLLWIEGIPGEKLKQSADAGANVVQRMVDMSPVIDLITSTAARGTWTIHDGDGKDVTTSGEPVTRGPVGRRSTTVGHITPFYLSVSLIVRHTKEGHDEVADLLRKLRRLLDARNHPEGVQGYDREVAKVGFLPGPHDPSKPAPAPVYIVNPVRDNALPGPHDPSEPARSASPTSPDRKARIGRLLDELRREVNKLPADDE